MEKYLIYVKGNVNENEKVPMTIMSKKPLSKPILNTIQDMRETDAHSYCKALRVQLLNGHIKDSEN